ncbi:hypothetical protein AGABI2DRAFT_122950 [Agaricus bisporus var. bisporus H97]|uniref:hypothetical protein n=1 Tax=Agaricus bisporus var. bisporus (strain H97 / ATCC MYA-4626 / FGSC 10389) TaxID=936046 RepID=UPI00029F6046|nr:hypothetical protein AGABI2DRAFT_122950 [Agaricus bisporus var. bisporus H97]EKV42221.1 hypothetical protein AGABI2DRAFT_122950 [Agaricus bisporus var. bisporus H97]
MPFSIRLPTFIVSILGLQALGQNSRLTFEWNFGGDVVGWSLPICQEIPITVSPDHLNATAGNFAGIPPYYMIAFPQNGLQPTTRFVGNNTDTLTWTPTHPVGTTFMLQLMDSTGSTGGATDIWKVTKSEFLNGSDSTNINVKSIGKGTTGNTDCAAPPPPAYFFVSSNMTEDGERTLETCEPWRLNINGGEPPYTVVLTATNSPVLTNVTVPEGNNALVYVNRADPNTVLFAGAVDRFGRWATGTQSIKTSGSTDYTCIGFRTIATTQEELDILNPKEFKRKRRLLAIACISAGLFSLMLVVGGFGISSNLRQKKLTKRKHLKLVSDNRHSLSSLSLSQTQSSSLAT